MDERRADADLARRIEDPFLRRSLKTALHLRRYLPFYVFGTIWIVTLSVFPGCGHYVHQEQPQLFADKTLRFLDDEHVLPARLLPRKPRH